MWREKNYFFFKKNQFLLDFYLIGNIDYFFEISIIFKKINIFKNIISRFSNFKNLLIFSKRRRLYNWVIFSRKRFRFFKKNLNYFFFKNLFFKRSKNIYKLVKSIVLFKKKISIFKKKNKIQMAFIRRLNTFRFKKSKIKPTFVPKRFKPVYSSKFLDLHKRTNQIYFNNRCLLRDFFGFNKFRQWAVTRVFSSFLKATPKHFLNSLENRLDYLLVLSKITLTIKESNFLIASGLVYINGALCTQKMSVVGVGDIVQLGLSEKFYRFYKLNLHFKTRIFKKISYSLWLINRFRNNFYKQSRNRVPLWINNLLFVYEDVPIFLEIDYVTLSICIVMKHTRFNHFNFFLKKTVALFLLRHYNWNYLT